MKVETNCPNCRKSFRVDETVIGRKVFFCWECRRVDLFHKPACGVVAMLHLFLCLSLCADEPAAKPADPIPKNILEYFQRADTAREAITKIHQTRISDLEILIRGESRVNRKANLRRELNQVENSFDELKRSKVFAYMPNEPAVGDIGVFAVARVRAVMDEHSVLAFVGEEKPTIIYGGGGPVLFTGIATKSIKANSWMNSVETWRVTAKSTEDKVVLRWLGSDDNEQSFRNAKKLFYVVEPVKKGEIEKHRAQYEAEKKQKKDVPAAPAGEDKPKGPPI